MVVGVNGVILLMFKCEVAVANELLVVAVVASDVSSSGEFVVDSHVAVGAIVVCIVDGKSVNVVDITTVGNVGDVVTGETECMVDGLTLLHVRPSQPSRHGHEPFCGLHSLLNEPTMSHRQGSHD